MNKHRNLVTAEDFRPVFLALIVLGCVSNFALAENEQFNGTNSNAVAAPTPEISLDGKSIQLPSGECNPIPDDLESKIPGLNRLEKSFNSKGLQFAWHKTFGGTSTYWNRERIDDARHRISMLVENLDLTLQFAATSIAAVLSENELKTGIHDDALLLDPISEGWSPGLSFILLDDTTHEGIHIGFWSFRNGDIWRPNAALRFLHKGSAVCRRLVGSN